MNERFDIDKFYVGELVLSESIKNFVTGEIDPEQAAKRDLKNVTVRNGAVQLDDSILLPDVDKNKGLLFHTYLTIFHKTMNGYMCLHNGLVFTMDHNDRCANLIKLTSLLPKVDYTPVSEVSNMEAIELFEVLFGRKINNELLGGNIQHSINQFYLGRLCICDGLENDTFSKYNTKGYIELNSILSKLTHINGALYVGTDETVDSKLLNGTYYYGLYKGIFMKQDNSYICIHNNQVYDDVTFDKTSKPSKLGETYCDSLIPLKKALDEKGKTKVMTISLNEGKRMIKDVF